MGTISKTPRLWTALLLLVILLHTAKLIKAQGCSEEIPLGLESGTIPDEDIICSQAASGCQKVRPNEFGWYTIESDGKDWVQVDLGVVRTVTKLDLFASDGGLFVWTFRLFHSPDGIMWHGYGSSNNSYLGDILPGNTYSRSKITYTLAGSGIKARYVVINPVEWLGEKGPQMKLELHGCSPDPPYQLPKTTVSSNIQVDTTWEVSNSPYYLQEKLEVASGVTLTIEAGVRVVFAEPKSGLIVKGSLIARGEPQNKILLSGYKMIYDYLVFGWRGLLTMDGGNVVLENVDLIQAAVGIEGPVDAIRTTETKIDYCPYGVKFTSGSADDSTAALHNTIISNGVVGLQMLVEPERPYIVLNGGTISYQQVFAVVPRTNDCTFKASGLTISNNTKNGIRVHDLERVKLDLTNCTFADNELVGITLDSKVKECAYYLNITNSVFRRNAHGIFLRTGQQTNDIGWEFQGNTFEDQLYSGLRIDMYGRNAIGKVLTVANNHFATNGVSENQAGLHVDGRYQIVGTFIVEGNTFYGNGKGMDFRLKHTLASPNLHVHINNNVVTKSVGSYGVYLDVVDLEFTGNTIQESLTSSIQLNRVFSNRFYGNIFNNPLIEYELETTTSFTNERLVNATYNYWGTADPEKARSRIGEFSTNIKYARVAILPMYTDSELTNLATGDNEVGFTVSATEIGGKLSADYTIPAHSQLTVTASIWIPPQRTLTIEKNCTLTFLHGRGIYTEGSLYGKGEPSQMIDFISPQGTTWAGIYLSGTDLSLQYSVMKNAEVYIDVNANTTKTSVNLKNVEASSGTVVVSAYVSTSLSLIITGCKFKNNLHGIQTTIGDKATANVTVYSSDISECGQNALTFSAAPLITSAQLLLKIMDSRFENNLITLSVPGGQAFQAALSISNSQVIGNRGQIFYLSSWFESISIQNCYIFNNSIGPNLYLQGNCSQITIANNTFSHSRSQHFTIKTDKGFGVCPVEISGNSFTGKADLYANALSIESSRFNRLRIVNNNFFEIIGTGLNVRVLRDLLELVVEENTFIRGSIALDVYIGQRGNPKLLISRNIFDGNSGSPVIQLQPYGFTVEKMKFINNLIRNNKGDTVVSLKTTTVQANNNVFDNPDATYNVRFDDIQSPTKEVDFTKNRWGTSSVSEISEGVFDKVDNPSLARINIEPLGTEPTCSGVDNCFSRGTCILTDECICDTGFQGLNCADVISATTASTSNEATTTARPTTTTTTTSQAVTTTTTTTTAAPTTTAKVSAEIGGLVDTQMTLLLSKSPYSVTSDILVSSNGVLTVEAGVELLFPTGLRLRSQGKVMIMGNVTHPVKFLPESSETKWTGLLFEQQSGEPMSRLQHVVVENTVQGVSVTGVPVHLDHVASDFSSGSGFNFAWGPTNAKTVMTGLMARNNSRSGVVINLGGAQESLEIADCHLQYNTENAISVTNIANVVINGCTISHSKRGIYVSRRAAGKLDILANQMFANSENCIKVDGTVGDKGSVEFHLESNVITNHNTSVVGRRGREGSTVIKIGLVTNKANNVWNITNNTFKGNNYNQYLFSVDNRYIAGEALTLSIVSNKFIENFSPILQAQLGGVFQNTIIFEGNIVDGSSSAVSTLYIDGQRFDKVSVRARSNVFEDVKGYCVIEYRGRLGQDVFDVDLSNNTFRNNQAVNSICTQVFGTIVDDSTFVNTNSKCDLTVPRFSPTLSVSAERCYWGSADLKNITEKLCGFEKDMTYARVKYWPYRLSPSSPDQLSSSMEVYGTDGALGGTINTEVNTAQSGVIWRSVYIEDQGSFTVQPGVQLQFAPNRGIYVKGILKVGSSEGAQSSFTPLSEPWFGIQIDPSPRDQLDAIRLLDSEEMREGRVELLHQGQYGTVCIRGFDKLDAIVACRSLGYSQIDDAEFYRWYVPGTGPILLSGLNCTGTESSLFDCPHDGLQNTSCTHQEDVGVVCYGGVGKRPVPLSKYSELHNLRMENTKNGIRIGSLNVMMSRVELSNTQATGVKITAPFDQFDFGGSIVRDSSQDGIEIRSVGSRGVANVTVQNSGQNGIAIFPTIGVTRVSDVNVTNSKAIGINIQFPYDHIGGQSAVVERCSVTNHANNYGLKIRTRSNIGPSFVQVHDNYLNNNTFGSLAVEINAVQPLNTPQTIDRSVSIRDNVIKRGGKSSVWAVNNISVEVQGNEFQSGGSQSDCLFLVRTGIYGSQTSTNSWRNVLVARNTFSGISGRCVAELRSQSAEAFNGEFINNNIVQCSSSVATLILNSEKYSILGNAIDNPGTTIEVKVEVTLPSSNSNASILAENNWWGTTNLPDISARVIDKEDDPSLYKLQVEPIRLQIIFDCSGVKQCNGTGDCVGQDKCSCHSGWRGTDCTQYHCSDVNDCSQRGDCVGPNTCKCSNGWTGQSCEAPTCLNVNNCSAQGTCIRPDECECDIGFDGLDCSVRSFVNSQGEMGGDVNGVVVLSLSRSPYVVTSSITVSSADTLVIEAGVRVLFQSGFQLYSEGNLTVMGSASQPVQFVSQTKGDKWAGVILAQKTGEPMSRLQHVVIEDTVQGVSVTGVPVHLDHVASDFSSGSGFNFAWGPTNAKTVMTGLMARNNSRSGVVINLGGAQESLEIADCHLQYNTENAISVTNTAHLIISGCTLSHSKRGIYVSRRAAGKLDILANQMFENSENCIKVDNSVGDKGSVEFNIENNIITNHNTSVTGRSGREGSSVIKIGLVSNNENNLWKIINNTFRDNNYNQYLFTVDNRYVAGQAFNLSIISNKFVDNFSPILQAQLGGAFQNMIIFEENVVNVSSAAVSTLYLDGFRFDKNTVRVRANVFENIKGYCVIEYRGRHGTDVFDVDLSNNTFRNNEAVNSICTQVFGTIVDDNIFLNTKSKCDLTVPRFSKNNYVSAKRCYWDSTDLNNITEKLCGFEKNMAYARVKYWPYRLSPSSPDQLSSSMEVFDTDGALGGTINTEVNAAQSGVIRRSIYVEEQGSFTVQPGVQLQFAPNRGIYAKGILKIGSSDGAQSALISLSEPWKGIEIESSPRDQLDAIRLLDSDQMREGRVELLHQGQYGTVCSRGFDKLDAIVACRSLGYSQIDDAEFYRWYVPGTGPILLSGLNCTGTESSLFDCPHDGLQNTSCTHQEDVGVVCYGGVGNRPVPLSKYSQLHNLRMDNTKDGIRIGSLNVMMSRVELSNTQATGIMITAPFDQFDFGGSIVRDSSFNGIEIQSVGSRGVANVTVQNSGQNGIAIFPTIGVTRVSDVNVTNSKAIGINIQFPYDHIGGQSAVVERCSVTNHANNYGLKIRTLSNIGPSFVQVHDNYLDNNTFGSLAVEINAVQPLNTPQTIDRSVSIRDNVIKRGGKSSVWAVNNISVEVQGNEFQSGGSQSDCLFLVRTGIYRPQTSTDDWRDVTVAWNSFSEISGRCVSELRSQSGEAFTGQFNNNSITQCASSVATLILNSEKYSLSDNNFDNPLSRFEVKVEATLPEGISDASILAPNNWWGTSNMQEVSARVLDIADDPTVYRILVEPIKLQMIFDCSGVNHCGGNGDCIEDNSCSCHSGWTGLDCTEYDCSDVSMCLGRGSCTGPNTCKCFSTGWMGDMCETPSCKMVNNCSAQGRCVSANECECDSGFRGSDCSHAIVTTDTPDAESTSTPDFSNTTDKITASTITGAVGSSSRVNVHPFMTLTLAVLWLIT